jgi:hypothetical protein
MKHWMFVGSLIILGTVFVARNKTQDRLTPPTTRGISVEQLKAATQRAREERATVERATVERDRLATQPTTRGITGVSIGQVRALKVTPTTLPTSEPTTLPSSASTSTPST